jgi:hypothetical protein
MYILYIYYISELKPQVDYIPSALDATNKIYHFVSKCIILLVAFYIIN